MPNLGFTDLSISHVPVLESMPAYYAPEPPRRPVSETRFRDVQIALLSEAGGGVMRHILDLHRGLVRRGWRATLILSPKRMDERYLSEVHALDKEHLSLIEMERSPHPSDLGALYRITSALKKMRGNRVLHAHSTKAGILGTFLSSEVGAMAYTPHAYRATDPSLPLFKRRALRGVEMAYSRPYDRIIAVSPSEREYTLNCGVDPDRVTCIPNGIDYTGNNTALRARRARAPQKLTLGFVGRLAYQKNPQLFVETLAHLVRLGYDVKAIVVGGGDLDAETKALAETLNVANRIEWRGEVPAGDSLGEMDLMVHTSRYEALPYTLLEAAAALLPVVATDNHGSRSVLKGELARNIVDKESPEALSTRILELIHNEDLWTRQLELLDQTAHAFSLDTMVTKVEQVYRSMLMERLEFSRSRMHYIAPAVSRIQPFA